MDKGHLLTTAGRTRVAAAAFLALLGAVMACQGRVFQRWGAAARAARTLEEMGGRHAYKSTVTVNAGRGRLSVFSFDTTAAEVVAEMKRRFPGARFAYDGGDMGYATVAAGGRVLRLLVARPASERRVLVFLLDQSDAEHEASRSPSPEHRLAAVPAFPGSRPAFFVSDEGTRMMLEASQTPASAGEVEAFLRSEMTAAGWEVPLPAGGAAAAPAMRAFVRGQEFCCVLVEPAPRAAGTRITVLHKEPAIQ